jgi:hypothetical protein
MKNIQVIDSADNCTYSLFRATNEEFAEIFPDDTDVEFSEEFFSRVGEARGIEVTHAIWARPVHKTEAKGIHGTLFYHLLAKKRFYPTKREAEMVALGAD